MPIYQIPETPAPAQLTPEQQKQQSDYLAQRLVGIKPEQSAENAAIADRLKQQYEYVRNNPQAAREELSRRNFSDAIANSPEVRRWLSGETSAADMAADDLDNLGAVARAGRKLSMWWDAAAGGIRAGWITNKQGEMWGRDEGFFDSSAHKLTDEEKSLSKAWDDEQEKLAEQYEGNWLYDAGNMGVSMAAGLWEHKAEAALIAAGAALLAPVTGGGSIGAGTALGAGLTGAMIISTRNVEGGLARKEALEAGCSAEEAEVARDVAGWTNTAIELGALKVLGKTVLKPAIKTFKAATTKAVIDVVGEGGLRKLGARQALGAAGKAWAAGMIVEPATEVLQEISTALVVEYAKIETDPSLASMSAQDLFDRVYDTAVTTLRAQAVLGMAGAGVRGASHYRMARRAKEFDGFLDAVAKSADTSKLRARAPSAFGRFVASLNGADRTIYVSGEAFNQAMADSGVSMETLEEVAGKDIADKVREADGAVDKTVAIPMGDYAAKISGTKLDEKLRPNIATEEGGLTYQETVQRQIEEQKLAAEYAKAEARIAAGDESAVALTPEQQEIKDVRTDMERQLLATGHVSPQEAHLNAILWTRSMYVLAKRSGRSLKDLYTKGSKEGGAMRFRIADEEGRSLQRDTPVDVRGGMDAIREVAQEVSDGIGGKEVSEGLRPLVGAVKGVADEKGRGAFDKLLAAVTPKEKGERRTMAQRLNEAQAAWRELPESVRSAIEAALPQELQTAIADARKQGEATQEQFRTFKQEVSTALPGANAIKGGKSLPPEFERHYVSLQEAMENPEWCKLAFKSLERGFGDERRGIHGLRSLMNSDDIRGSIEAAVQRMADNLLWLYNKVPARVRARSKMWYVGAYRTTLEWEKRYGISRRQAAAIIAVFSPKTNWFINMSMAERLLDIYFSDAAKTKPNAAMKESIVAVAKTLVKPPKGMPSRPKLPASDKAKRKKQRAEWKKTPPAGEKEKEQQEATKAAWAEQDKKLAEAQAKWDAEFDLYLKPRVERLQGLTLREVLADMKPAPVGDKKARAAQDKHNKPTLEDAAIWIRAYDATFNSRHINVINPEGGNALDEQGRPVLYTPAPTPVTDKDKNPIPEESGELELDRDGNPVPLLNDDGTPVVDMVPKLDGDGNAVTDEAGNPVLVESIRYRPKYKMKQSGPLNFSFGPASPIIKALKILEQDDMQTIFDEIGTEFKVRDFYNNIYNPWNKHAATIDTHAVGAATLTVVSGETDYVEENFGSRVPNAETGQTGTFPIFFEAYKRAAEAAGVSPREMQSVTWEAIRAIFKDTEKPELKPRVDAIWDMAERGEITPEEARERVFRLAGGLRKTSWEASPWNEKIGDTYDRSQVKITPQKHAPADARLTMDVAPALMNLEQAGKWMLLTPEEQRAVMNEVLPWIVGRVAAATKTFISDLNFVRTSSPTGRPQYKMYCGIADRGDFVTVGKLLASYLKLRSVSVISPEQRGDLSRRNVIRIEMPEHWTLEQKDYLYSHWLAPLTSKDAAGVEHPVVPEHFTEGRVMLIHVDPADEAAVKAQLKKAADADDSELTVSQDDAFAGEVAAFTDKEINDASSLDNGPEGKGGVRSKVREAGYDPNLRRECARRFRDAVESRLAARDGGLGPWANPGLPVSEWIRRLSVAYGEGEGGYDFRTEATAKWGPRAGQAIAAGRAGFVGRCLGLTYAHREGSGPAGGDRGLEVWSPDPKLKALYEANGVSAPEFYKLSHSEEDARVFHDAIAQTRDPGKNPHFASVYVYSVEEYREMDLFMDADRTCGIAVKKDGDIVSVFKLSNCKHRRVVHSLIEVAKAAGGNHLDCYDTVLPRLYSVHGFRATVRQHWNEDYKPDGWDKNIYQGYGPAGAGDPDVVYMSYDPDYYGFYDPFSGYVIDDYDETQRLAGEGLREITAAAEDRRQGRALRQAAMDGEDAPAALPPSNELQFGARIERREFASRTPAQWIDELRDAHQVPHDAVSAEKISMMQDLLKAGSMADVRSIPVEAREHGISQEVLDWFQVVVMDPLEASQNLIEFAKADHRLTAAERELDQKYEALVRAGDIEGARQLVEQKLEAMGLSDAIPDQCRSYRIRTRSAPKKTITVYKTFTVDADGAPTTLFVGGADKIPQGVWLDALDCWHFVEPETGRKYVPSFKNPNSDGGKTGDMHKFSADDRQYLLDHGYITAANKSGKVTCLKYRPGWHAGDMPFFPQGGKKVAGSNHGNVHRWNQVVFMCEFAADADFTELAQNQSKARAKSGKLHAQEADLDYIPEDGFYRYSTNPLIAGREDVFGNWMISGSMRIVRAMTQEECDSMLIRHGLKPQEWEQGKLDLNALHVPEGEQDESARKTVAPITYDETGKVIPLSSRFNRDSRNVLYQKADAWTPDEDLIARAKETFGITTDPHEAFYMLPDGTMLDGSGRHWGGDERDVAGQRQVDHQDIGEVVDSSGADAMYEWMARTGAARMDMITGIASIARPPTAAQLSALGRIYKGKYLALSFNTPEGRIVNDTEFESASPRKIEDFFADAKARYARGDIAGAFAQTQESAEAQEFRERIASWIQPAVLQEAAGKSREEIFKLYGNQPEPIARLPEAYLSAFTTQSSDGLVYTGKGYFIDHVVNHHAADVPAEAYLRIQEIIDTCDEVIKDTRNGRDGLIFVKKLEDNYLLAVGMDKDSEGKIHLYKSLSKTKKGKPYPKLDRVPVNGISTKELPRYTRTPEEARGGSRFSALGKGSVPKQPKKARASSGPRGSFDPHANTITLTPNANLSTFSHEMGHWFFETVMDLAQQPGAEPGLVADAKTLMKSLGIADFEDWKTMDWDRVEAAHETFAAWTEEYLATAKPPVPELGSIMRRLGDWICNVYRDLTGRPHVHEHLSARVKANYGFELPELSDEVRGVLDRMVAAEDEIEAANLADSTPEIFMERPAFVTDDDWAEYLAAREASLSEARDVLAGKKLEGMRWAKSAGSRVLKKMQGESRQLRRMAERDARGELMTPGTLYWHMENVRQLPRDMKPSFDEVMACIEDGQLDGILTREQAAELVKRGWLAGRGKGMPLGEFVTAFGAPDFPAFAKQYFGEALNPTLEDEVQRLADKTMEENFPLYASDKAMEDKAAEAVANEAGVRTVAAELSFLRDLEAGERETARIMNAAAEDQVGAEGEPVKTVEDFLREAKSQQKLMDAAIRRGDDAAVVEAKSQRDLAIAKARRLSKLARDTLTATKIETEAAKEAAKSAIGRLQVSEVTPKRFMNLAAKFRKQAVVAYQRGDLQTAIKAKQAQLMYQAMAKAAVDFQQRDIHHIKTMAKRFTLSDEKLKSARSIDLVNFGRAVLGRFGLVSEKRASSAEEELEKIRKYDPETARGLDAVLAGAASPMKWTELAVDDFHALSDQVDAIWDISKRTKEMEVEGRSVALADAAAQLTEQLDARFGGKRRKSVLGTDETTQMQRAMKCADHFFAGLRRVEAWCQDMDRGNPKQPFTRFIWRPVSDAVNAYNLAKRGYYSRLRDIFDRYGEEADRVPGKITADELINPETGEPFVFSDKSALIGALLHTGNASNKSKLVGGYGWGEINEETGAVDMGAWDSFVQRMIDTKVLTQRDFDFVQEIWDLLEEMKPETQKAHHRMTGMYFDEITEQPFTVTFPDGKQVTYKGGYVPAMVDKNKESRNVADEERDLSAVGQSFDFPNSGNGFTKTRAEGYKKPLILSVDMVPAHIDQVLRYTYIQPAAVEVYRLVKNEETRKTIMSYGNSEAVDGMLVPWLSRTVKQRVSIPTAEGSWRAIENATSQLRSRTGMAIMCGNLSNALQQISGFSLSAAVVKPSFLASAAKSILFGEVTVADIKALSPYMASRLDDNQVVALERAVEEFKLKATKLDKAKAFMQAHSYFLQEAFQKLVDIPTWLGAYNQALAEGYEPAEAVQRADRDVRMTQSSNAAQDVSAIETGNALQRSLMMFFNYFDMIYNLSVNEFGDAFRRREYGRMAWAYATIILLPTLISDVIKEDLLGAGDGDSGDDDDDPWIKWVTIKLLSASLRGSAGMIPGGGAVGTMIDNRLTGKPRSLSLDRLNPSPVLSSLETVSQVPADLMDAANGRKYKKAIKDGLMVISLAGYPVYQLGKPLGYMADIMEGKSELPSNPVKAAQGLVIGREPK